MTTPSNDKQRLDQQQRRRRDLERQLPWNQPATLYETDGPLRGSLDFEVRTHDDRVVRLLVSATGETGLNSGRGRFEVRCQTCERERGLHYAIVHPGTTGTTQRIVDHILEAHS